MHVRLQHVPDAMSLGSDVGQLGRVRLVEEHNMGCSDRESCTNTVCCQAILQGTFGSCCKSYICNLVLLDNVVQFFQGHPQHTGRALLGWQHDTMLMLHC